MMDIFFTDEETKQKDESMREATEMVAIAHTFAVVDRESFAKAAALGQECSRRMKAIDDRFRDSREKAHAAWKAITELIASLKRPLENVRDDISRKAQIWKREEDRRLAEEARKAAEEARRKAEEEKLAAAVAMETAGKTMEAEAVLDEPVEIFAPAAEKVTVEGVQFRANWQVEVTSLQAMVKAVAAGKAPVDLLMANMVALRQFAKATKGKVPIEGVRFFDAGTVAYGRK